MPNLFPRFVCIVNSLCDISKLKFCINFCVKLILHLASSIVNEVIRTILSQFIFFLRKHFERNKSTKTQNKNFPTLRSFAVQIIVASVVFCSHIFVLLVDFYLIYIFVCSKFFRTKNWTCPDNLIYYTTEV